MKKIYAMMAIVTGLSLLLAACGGSAQTPEEIKIAYLGPLTGNAAFVGEEQGGFTKAALDIFNQDTGMNISIEEFDTEVQPDTGAVVSERAVADEAIYAAVGPAGSQVCEAVQPIFAEAGLVHITPSCTNPGLTEPGTPTFFRPIPTDADQGPTAAGYMVEELGVESAFFIDDQTTYAQGLVEATSSAMEELGVTDLGFASVSPDETDLSSVATRIVNGGFDAVMFPAQTPLQLSSLIIRLREQGWEGIYFNGDSAFDEEWVEAAEDAVEPAYLTFFAPALKDVPTMQPYIERFQAEYGEDFGALGGPAALATRLALEAIQSCVQNDTLNRECVRDEVAGTQLSAEESILGYPVSFNSNGDLEGGEFRVFKIEGGEFILVGP